MPIINGLDIHHEVQGAGPPLLFIHGLGATSNAWHAQRVTLSKYFQVIVYDRSGCGLSPRSPAGYSVDAWADEAAGLLDALAIPKAVVFGHSLGSMIAQRFAGQYAERTRALILAGGEAELTPEGKQILTDRASAIEANGLTAAADGWLAAVLSAATREANPALAGLLRAMFLANDARTYAQQARALRDGDVRGDHPRIVCPTLLLVGDQDAVTPLSWQQEIAAHIRNSRIRVMPFTGHFTMLEAPAVFNSAVLDFLATLEP